MNKDVLTAICRMAVDFSSSEDISMRELFNRSNYREAKAEITEKLIEDCLGNNTEWVESWLRFSLDTRSAPAWYISSKNNIWCVGLYPDGDEFQFNDKTRACACYVKRYLDGLSELQNNCN